MKLGLLHFLKSFFSYPIGGRSKGDTALSDTEQVKHTTQLFKAAKHRKPQDIPDVGFLTPKEEQELTKAVKVVKITPVVKSGSFKTKSVKTPKKTEKSDKSNIKVLKNKPKKEAKKK